jgi:Trypsin-co-occurring domain 1
MPTIIVNARRGLARYSRKWVTPGFAEPSGRASTMTQLVSFPSEEGPPLVVEVADNSYGLQRVARGDDEIVQSSLKLEDALKRAMPTLRSIVRKIQDLSPDSAEIEFGVSLNAEAGVVVAKTAVAGNFTVRLSWDGSAKDSAKRPASDPASGSAPGSGTGSASTGR